MIKCNERINVFYVMKNVWELIMAIVAYQRIEHWIGIVNL